MFEMLSLKGKKRCTNLSVKGNMKWCWQISKFQLTYILEWVRSFCLGYSYENKCKCCQIQFKRLMKYEVRGKANWSDIIRGHCGDDLKWPRGDHNWHASQQTRVGWSKVEDILLKLPPQSPPKGFPRILLNIV